MYVKRRVAHVCRILHVHPTEFVSRLAIATGILVDTHVSTIIRNDRREKKPKSTSVSKGDVVRRVELPILAATTTNVADPSAKHADRTGRWGKSVTCGHYKMSCLHATISCTCSMILRRHRRLDIPKRPRNTSRIWSVYNRCVRNASI
jgi:hypothetical protein